MKRTLLLGGGTLLLFLTLVGCQPTEPRATPDCEPAVRLLNVSSISGDIIEHLSVKEVVITLDDGPHFLRTKRVLNVLDQHCLKATFFLQGRHIEWHPEIVRDVAARGHTLGSHSYDHENLTDMEIEPALAEIKRGHDPIAQVFLNDPNAKTTTLFRFPFVATTPELSAAVSRAGYRAITVHADGEDWTRNTPDQSTMLILEKLRERGEKGIILLHDPMRRSDKRLDHLIEALIQDGYSFVHLVENDHE